jgi:PAS domain S-box-containing protein
MPKLSSTARSEARSRPVDAADLAAAFEHAAAGMAITDEGAIILHANASLGDILGYSPAALVGRSVGDLTHPDDLPVSLAENRRLARGEVSQFSLEKRYLHASGRPVWTRVHVSLLTHGGRRHHLLHVVDIGHERSTAALLRESQERFREMTESVEQDFWLMGVEPLQLLYTSPAAVRIWGFDPMVNRDDPQRIFERVLPEDLATFLGLFEALGKGSREREYRVLRADGAVRWLRTRIVPMYNPAGAVDRLAGTTEDVTPRKQAELAVDHSRVFERVLLRLSEEFVNLPTERLQEGFERALGALGTLFGAERATIFLMDERGEALDVRYTWGAIGLDPGSVRFTEYSFAPDNLVRGMLDRDGRLLVEDVTTLPDAVADSRTRLLANGVGSFVAVPLVRQGRLIGLYGCSNRRPTAWPREMAQRMKIAAELFSSAIERARIEAAIRTHHEALAHALRVGTLGQLASGIAHELNQPLASILNYAHGFEHRLACGQVDVAMLREGARKIAEQALRASDVIATLRALVRKGQARRSWHDANELVRTALRFIEPEVTHAGVRLVAEHAPALPRVQVDPIQIEQVVLNLVRNALDAVRDLADGARREIRVVTRPGEAGTVEIGVMDRGPGIDPSRAQVVFDEFYTTKPDGLGLGLSISRSIIDAHGGRLWIDTSAAPGATFRFTLSGSA